MCELLFQDYDSDRFEVRWTADADADIHIGGQLVGTMRTLPVSEPKWYNCVCIERLHATEPYHTEDVVVWFKATDILFRVRRSIFSRAENRVGLCLLDIVIANNFP